MYLRSASTAIDLAERALGAGLPVEPHHAWAGLALVSSRSRTASRRLGGGPDEILAEARDRGAALTVATVLAHRAFIDVRRGDLISAEADAQAAIALASDLLGSEFVVVVAARCAVDHPMFGGENPAMVPWRSAAAVSLAELGRHDEARSLASEEVRRARSFGAPRAIGIAMRAQALVGPGTERAEGLQAALEVLAPSPARLEHAWVLLDLGATLRAAGQAPQRGSPCSKGSLWPPAAAPEPWSAGRAPSLRHSASSRSRHGGNSLTCWRARGTAISSRAQTTEPFPHQTAGPKSGVCRWAALVAVASGWAPLLRRRERPSMVRGECGRLPKTWSR